MSVLSLAEAKAYATITESADDAEVQALIDSAEAILTQRVGPLESTTITRRLDGGNWALVLPITPVISLTSITPSTGSALNLSDLYVDIRTGIVSYNVPRSFAAIYYTVVYEAGRATCPADLLLADKELVRHLWQPKRGSGRRPNAEPIPQPRPGATTSVPGTAYLLPPRVEQLIAPHIQLGVG